ncbi:hypothetical protein E2C01_091181 [Portunus trituberculatus]|uniref:Uncharacterized protein n=1 Tax=Portunus trituberculatus TaxID=210409 RepID=A0A5B7JDB3_PORTR|nr:hypothetical protein [Portunus trituberculatus]
MAKCLRLYVVGFEPTRGRLPVWHEEVSHTPRPPEELSLQGAVAVATPDPTLTTLSTKRC